MIGKIIAFFVELFRKKPEKQSHLENSVEELEEILENVENSKLNEDEIVDYLNEE